MTTAKELAGSKRFIIATLALALALPISMPNIAEAIPVGPMVGPMWWGATGAGTETLAPGGMIAMATAQSPTVEGTWSTRARERDNGRRRIQISMQVDGDGTWQMGFSVEDGGLNGLSFEQARGTSDTVRFQLVRDAGTVAFEGLIRDGRGAGTFSFTPDTGWQRDMAGFGYDDLSDKQVFSAAIHDISTAYVQDLQRLGYTGLAENHLFSFAIHGVSVAFITGMNGLGYEDIAAQDLITMRIHGVTPEWVREVRAAMGG